MSTSLADINSKQTIDELEKRIKNNNTDLDSYIKLSLLHGKNLNFDSAIFVLKNYISSDNMKKSLLYNNIAGFNFEKNNPREAIRYLKKSISFSKNNPLPYRNLNEYYFFKKNYDESLKTTEKYLLINKSGHKYWIKNILINHGLYDKSNLLTVLDKVANKYSENGDFHYLKATIYHHSKDYDRARNEYEKAFELFSNFDIKAMNNISAIHLHNNNLDEAIIYARRSLDLNPNYYFGHYNLAYIYYKQKRYSEAITKYKKCIELFPNKIDPYLELIDLYYDTKNTKEEKNIINRVLSSSLDCDNDCLYSLYKNIGIIYNKENNYLESIKYLDKALSLSNISNNRTNKKSTSVIYTALSMNYKKTDIDKSIKYLKMSLTVQNNNDIDVNLTHNHYNLAKLYIKLEKNKSAFIHLRKALDSYIPDNNKSRITKNDIIIELIQLHLFVDDLDSALKYYKLVMSDNSSEHDKFIINYLVANWYSLRVKLSDPGNELITSIVYFDKAESILNSNPGIVKEETLIDFYMNIGTNYVVKSNTDLSCKNLRKSLAISKRRETDDKYKSRLGHYKWLAHCSFY